MNLGVIAARGGSKGFPRKNLRLLDGRPLIEHTIMAARRSHCLDDFLVSTDDPAIADAARAAGAKVPFMRPPELATDEVSIWPTLRHAAEQWERASGSVADAVVLLQPTSPLRLPEDIDGCVARFWELQANICVTVVRAHDSPYFNLVEPVPGSAFFHACSPLMLDHSRRQEVPPVYALNGAVYVVRRSVLPELENQFRVEHFAVYEMPRVRSLDIDGPEDLELAEWVLCRTRESIA